MTPPSGAHAPRQAFEYAASLTDLRYMLAAGQVSARTLTERALAAIADSAEPLNTFCCVRGEDALADADDADRRLASGDTSALLGIPVAVKDDMDVVGQPTAMGCPGIFPIQVADSEAVRRLKAAGAIIVGKTTTPELCQWPITETHAVGVTRNPWNLQHTPGGSSGGAAAAVAAGLVAAALGSDAAGSIRIPAAWTHLIGLKPQRGRVPTWPQHDACYGLTSFGPLTRTVADAAIMLDALTASPTRGAHRASTAFAEAARREPPRLRIALSLRMPFNGHPASLDPRIRSAVQSLADTLTDLGHNVTAEDPRYGLVGLSFLPRAMAGLRDLSRAVPDISALDPRTRAAIRTGSLLQPTIVAARAAEPLLRHRMERLFERYDVVLAPTTALPPPETGYLDGLNRWRTDRAVIAACPYAWTWNVIGWPAINIPAGILDGGLPIGASLLGPSDSESLLLSLAAQIEHIRRWQDLTPNDAFAAAGAHRQALTPVHR
jgi:amidase